MKQRMNERGYEKFAQQFTKEENKISAKLEKAIDLLTTFGNLAENNFKTRSKVNVDLILKEIDESIYNLQDMLILNEIDVDRVFGKQPAMNITTAIPLRM